MAINGMVAAMIHDALKRTDAEDVPALIEEHLTRYPNDAGDVLRLSVAAVDYLESRGFRA